MPSIKVRSFAFDQEGNTFIGGVQGLDLDVINNVPFIRSYLKETFLVKIGGNDPALKIIGRKGKHSGVIVIVMGMRNKDIQWFFFIEKGQCALIIKEVC